MSEGSGVVCMLGAAEGDLLRGKTLGAIEGRLEVLRRTPLVPTDGIKEGRSEGSPVDGLPVGKSDGAATGTAEGDTDGACVANEGASEGIDVRDADGVIDGFADGARVGPAVVDTVGVMVGSREGTMEEGVRDGRSRHNFNL